MNRKVTDILPPKEIEKPPTTFRKDKLKQTVQIKTIKHKKVVGGKKGLISFLFILLLVWVFCFFTLSKANIEVWPETDTLTLKTKLTVDKTAELPDFSAKIIPGEILKKEKIITENFFTSSKSFEEKKAEGTIRVYNVYSTYSQVFVATTRFVSADGKTFRTPTRVTIPGGRYEQGELVPGEVDIRVVADQPGPEYNIEPTTFSIPGFAGTDRYTKFYAKSFQPMEGGLREEVNQVTKEDLEEAESLLANKAKEQSKVALENELQSEKVSLEFNFLENAIQTEIVETFSLVKVGDMVEDFNFQVKAKSEALLFKKEDFKNFAKEFILSQISEKADQKIYEESLKINSVPETINLNAGKIVLSLEISAKIYSDIDSSNLKNALKGKSLLETKVFLENQPEITKAEIEFWPFWVKKVPEDSDKIELKLNID